MCFLKTTCLNELASFKAGIISTFSRAVSCQKKNTNRFFYGLDNSIIIFCGLCCYDMIQVQVHIDIYVHTCLNQEEEKMGWKGRGSVVSKILRRWSRCPDWCILPCNPFSWNMGRTHECERISSSYLDYFVRQK